MKKIVLIIALFVLGCTSYDSKCELSESEKNEIIIEIELKIQGYADAVKRSDVEWLLNFWADDKDFVFAGDGEIVDYQLGIDKRIRDFFEETKKVRHVEIMNGHTYILGKEAVSYVTEFDWSIITKSDDTINSKGSWLYVFKKFDMDWKVIHSAGTHIYY